jgi:NAD(P)-dependent dehydrogenase (short-subunit alcohol dehydrogenase family)
MMIQDKVAVVTGAGSGLGRATALLLAGSGAMVAVLDRDREAAEATAAKVPDQMRAFGVNVADEESVERAFAEIESRFGGVHVCVNAAGVATPGKTVSRGAPLPMEDFRRVLSVNLLGLFDVLRRSAALMSRNNPEDDGERGVIVNVSSGAAWQGQKGQAAYAASKAAVIGLMLPVARDLAGYGIRVMTVAPGLFDTGMSAGFSDQVREQLSGIALFPPRMGAAEEFADLVAHIVTNRYLNASTVSLDAGARMT